MPNGPEPGGGTARLLRLLWVTRLRATSDDELAVLLQHLAVDLDPAALAQVADHVRSGRRTR